jgi:hypothetical protein
MAYDQPTIERKGVSEPSTRVYRPSSSGPASSTNPDEQSLYDHQINEPEHDHRSTTPPPYSGPTTTTMTVRSAAPPQQPTYPGLPRLDYKLYSPPSFTLSQDTITITSYEPRLSIYPNALVTLIKSLATVPPKPQVRIVGRNGGRSDGNLDFDIKLNMMNLIVPEGEETGNMNYVKVIGDGEMGLRGGLKPSLVPDHISLEEWAKRYCEDPGQIKQ